MIMLKYGEKNQSLTDWSTELNIQIKTLRYRLRSGWTPGQILGLEEKENQVQPYNFLRRRRLEYNGQNLTYAEWEVQTGVSAMILYTRIKRGWKPEYALFAPKWCRLETWEWTSKQ